jgi:thiol-disulfide isomerase/thioredoxin
MISIPYPRRIFSDQELESTTIKGAGLAPKGMAIVQENIAVDMKQDKTPIVTPGFYPGFFLTEILGVKHVHSEAEYSKFKGVPNRLVVVKFSADWCVASDGGSEMLIFLLRCGPCNAIAPLYEQLAKKHTNATFLHVDTDKTRLADGADVEGIPTFKFFKNGRLVDSFSGADERSLRSKVEQHSK